jgi:hemerythrin-like domain-containing protein
MKGSLTLIDHRYLKECIELYTDPAADKKLKLVSAKAFLEAVLKHSAAEQEAIYSRLEKNPDLHFNILEAEVEHAMIEKKVRSLKPRFNNTRYLRDEVEAELKVLADLLKHHIMEEESETLPKMYESLDDETLGDLGKAFMNIRKFSAQDLKDYPDLQDELIQWKDNIQKVSSEFLAKMDKFVENMQH